MIRTPGHHKGPLRAESTRPPRGAVLQHGPDGRAVAPEEEAVARNPRRHRLAQAERRLDAAAVPGRWKAAGEEARACFRRAHRSQIGRLRLLEEADGGEGTTRRRM